VLRNWRITNNYNQDRSSYRHTGIDIPAPKMTPVLAPIAETLGFKTETFWIYGANEYAFLGTHLNNDTPGTRDNQAHPDFMFAPNLRKGDRVIAGQLIGYVGDSGIASGPHLNFEMFDAKRRLVNPLGALKRVQQLTTPRLKVKPPKPRNGEIGIAGCIRGVNSQTREVTLLLTAVKRPNRPAEAVLVPRWITLKFKSSVTRLHDAPRDRELLAVVVPNSMGTYGAVVSFSPPK
jgi:hypothetical protein